MSGPVLGFCAGRIDYVDNAQTRALGPTLEQEEFATCPDEGDCQYPLGTNTLGLIYVNAEGPFGNPDPQGAADTIRDVFGRMVWSDRETVALIGGGHTFGKSHGAGPENPGSTPAEDPVNPWPGNYGTGKGNDTVTSGFEGPWTDQPTEWNNDYFTNLVDFEWEKHIGPGGHWQWRVKGQPSPQAPMVQSRGVDTSNVQDIMMFTTDIALKVDPEYRTHVDDFAKNETALADEFAIVWYKLVTRDMGPYSRCTGPDVPPPQDFQSPLPDTPGDLADMSVVDVKIQDLLNDNPDADFVRLATQCANTHRITDYRGGCDGARIRFSPGKDWQTNAGLNETLSLLEPIKEEFGDGLSWADLIVLAGNVQAKQLGAPDDLSFCPGRTDAADGSGWDLLELGNANAPISISDVVQRYERQGLSAKEYAVFTLFQAYPNSTEDVQAFFAAPPDASMHTNGSTSNEGNANADFVTIAVKYHPDLRTWTEYYANSSDEVYRNDFGKVWTKVMNADRFDGPVNNICDTVTKASD
jgi:catalase-peroxidase